MPELRLAAREVPSDLGERRKRPTRGRCRFGQHAVIAIRGADVGLGQADHFADGDVARRASKAKADPQARQGAPRVEVAGKQRAGQGKSGRSAPRPIITSTGKIKLLQFERIRFNLIEIRYKRIRSRQSLQRLVVRTRVYGTNSLSPTKPRYQPPDRSCSLTTSTLHSRVECSSVTRTTSLRSDSGCFGRFT